MQRLARIDIPGLIHHVIIRAIERRKIFRDNNEGARLARRFNMSQAGVGYAVKRGEKIVKETAIPMTEKLVNF
jgi:hypothetical protein